MSRMHGSPGLVDNIRLFSDLVDDTGADRRPFLDLYPGVQVTAWAIDTGRTYVARCHNVFDGMLRDIVSVDTDLGALGRVESLAACRATAGTYFADIDGARLTSVPYWDDGVTLWDGGATWDTFGASPQLDLYVHMPADADPNGYTVIANLGFYFGTKGEVHASVSGDQFTNGEFESLTGWTESGAGGGYSSALDSVNFKSGTNSLKLVSAGGASLLGAGVQRTQDMPTQIGVQYVVAGYYRTDPAFDSTNLQARLVVSDTGASFFAFSDGRDFGGAGTVPLTPTYGEWRAFWFAYVAGFATTRVGFRLHQITGTQGVGQVNFDKVHHRRIWRYVYYEPRLHDQSIPAVEVASTSIFFSGKTFGVANLSLVNGDGTLESIFGQLLMENRTAQISVAGNFGDGQELSRDDWAPAWPGITSNIVVNDSEIKIDADDRRALYGDFELPIGIYSKKDYPNLDQNIQDQPRPLCYAFSFVKPKRIDKSSTTGFGTYELVDPTYGSVASSGAPADGAFIFANDDDASKELFPFQLTAGTHYNLINGNTQVQIIADIRNYRFKRDGKTQVGDNAKFDFDIGAGALVANFNMRGPANSVAADLQASMRAAAAVADIFVIVDDAAHKFTVSKTAGALNLRGATGANSYFDYWQYLGYSHADHTGALSYTAESATFDDCDKDHVFRMLAYGYVDDAAGTITGTPGALIKKHAHVGKHLLKTVAGSDGSLFDAVSFAAAAALETGTSGSNNDHAWLYLEEKTKLVGDDNALLSQIETGLLADFIIDAAGVWHLNAYQNAVVVQTFTDRDYLSWEMSHDASEVYRRTRIRHAKSPNRGVYLATDSFDDTSVRKKYGREPVRQVTTMLASSSTLSTDNPSVLVNRLQRLASAAPRRVTFSARSKLVGVMIGDKITLTRTRALSSTGNLSAVNFRVQKMQHDYIAGVSTCTAIEDVSFL